MAFESTSGGNQTVTAFFDDRSAADNAVADADDLDVCAVEFHRNRAVVELLGQRRDQGGDRAAPEAVRQVAAQSDGEGQHPGAGQGNALLEREFQSLTLAGFDTASRVADLDQAAQLCAIMLSTR